IVTRGSVIPVTELDKAPLIMASTALLHILGVRYVGFEGAYVKLRPGAAAAVLSHQAQSLAREFPATGRQVFVADEGTQVGAIGPARLAEPSPGLSIDVPVLLIGSAATVALLLARAALPAWRLASAGYRGQGQAARARGRRSALTQWLASAGAPITATTGVRLA